MLKRILQSLIGAAVIVASLPLQIVAADNDTPTEFDYSTATVNLNIRVLDEGKRYVDKLDISTASTSENCGLTIQNA